MTPTPYSHIADPEVTLLVVIQIGGTGPPVDPSPEVGDRYAHIVVDRTAD